MVEIKNQQQRSIIKIIFKRKVVEISLEISCICTINTLVCVIHVRLPIVHVSLYYIHFLYEYYEKIEKRKYL